jgi:LacI family transcriptional regulator
MPRPVTQRQLARELRISTAAVSKVFRNGSDVSEETRARVLDAAARRGYRLPEGRAFAAGAGPAAARFIGVFYCQGPPLPAEPREQQQHGSVLYLDGLSEAASRFNVSLVVHRVGGDSSDILEPAKQPPAFRDGLLAGLVLIYRFEPHVVQALARQSPCVTLTHFVPGARCDHVDSDHIGGMSKLVEHLHGQGHRCIGYLGGARPFAYDEARFGSYARALARFGLGFKPWMLINAIEHDADARRVTERAVAAMARGVTAWCCVSDGAARALWRELRGRCVRVPRDVSITGFDANQPWPDEERITTVAAPFRDMGVEAVRTLLRRIEDPTAPRRQVLLDCALELGVSTGPAPEAGKGKR